MTELLENESFQLYPMFWLNFAGFPLKTMVKGGGGGGGGWVQLTADLGNICGDPVRSLPPLQIRDKREIRCHEDSNTCCFRSHIPIRHGRELGNDHRSLQMIKLCIKRIHRKNRKAILRHNWQALLVYC